MVKKSNNQRFSYKTAEEISFSILINNCSRELQNSTFYHGIPKYDNNLAEQMIKSGSELFLLFTFDSEGIEVFVPVSYRSECLSHDFIFPVFERNIQSGEICNISIDRFTQLIISECKAKYPDVNESNFLIRLHQSIDNVSIFLEYFEKNNSKVNHQFQTFIEAEHNLVTGHNFHPLTKSREGFTREDLIMYSPEMNGRFKIHYFLVHPDAVLERSAMDKPFSLLMREEIFRHVSDGSETHVHLTEKSDWKPVPVHPWEARYLLGTSDVKEMLSEGVLIDLGPLGPFYTATASVRTVYNEENLWMFKFSMHVKITSAERINHLEEMFRGYDFSRLLNKAVNKELHKDHSDIEFLNDPGFISVHLRGKNIEGFNTSFRVNPFVGARAKTNTGLLASLCQDGILNHNPRIVSVMEATANALGCSITDAAKKWFGKYLDILLHTTTTMFEKYGFICELHQQNVLIELDESYMPSRLYLRDNQSYLFRKECKKKICSVLKDLEGEESAFVGDTELLDLLSHFLITSNIMALIKVFGCNQIIEERELIKIFYDKVNQIHIKTPGCITDYLLNNRHWCLKGNLLTALRNIDASKIPTSVVYTSYLNIFNKRFITDKILSPKSNEVVFSRYFHKEDITISFRPVDPDQDLEMLHEWFHREHTLKIWKMNWPIDQLEHYYRKSKAGNLMQSYIGMLNGEPTFNFEVYWATADIVGDYYDVLPDDYGTHFMIATVDKNKKYPSQCMQALMDWLFAHPEVGRLVGEGSVESLAALMNKVHVGFRLEKVIEMPHKKANLNMCYREWYWEKFPQNKHIEEYQKLELNHTYIHE